MQEQEVIRYWQNESPVIFHHKNYYIVGINRLNKTVDLQRASMIGLTLSDRTVNNISFNDLEI